MQLFQTILQKKFKIIKQKLLTIPIDAIMLDEQAKEVVVYISGYIVQKIKHNSEMCCSNLLIGEPKDVKYLKLLSRGGLFIPSQSLCDYTSDCFGILDAILSFVQKNKLPTRTTFKIIHSNSVHPTGFSCEYHLQAISQK